MKRTLSFYDLPHEVSQLSEKLDRLETLLRNNQPEPTEAPDQLLTVDETAKFLHLTKPTIYSKVSRGELPYMKRGKKLHFSRKELLDYLKEGRQKTNTEVEAEAEAYLSNSKRNGGRANG